MDYWTLLCKYTRHIAEMEGVNFTDHVSMRETDVPFTAEEVTALRSAAVQGQLDALAECQVRPANTDKGNQQ